MNGVGARAARRVDNAIDSQVAVLWRARPDGIRLVGVPHVQGRAVTLGIDGHRRQVHFPARANDAHGDLAAVGDQDLVHG